MANVIPITDFSATEFDLYARYTENQLRHLYEPKEGVFIAESPKVVERALDAGCVPISCLVETKHIDTQAKSVLERLGDVPVYTAEYEVLTQLTGYALARGMLCAMRRPKLLTVENIVKTAKRIAVLENVVNPTNIGAIFRSAAALNMDAVLLTSGCSDALYRRAIRVSMGTVFQIPWTILTDKKGCAGTNIAELRRLGFKTAAMALTDDSVCIDNPNIKQEEKLAIVLGTEGEGLAKQTISECDYVVRIPMTHGVDSLNVAAASAVAFWELGK